MSFAGRICKVELGNPWWADLPRASWPSDVEALAASDKWSPVHGDRRQRLVVIGLRFDASTVRAHLDACLLTPEEARESRRAWAALPQPFEDLVQ